MKKILLLSAVTSSMLLAKTYSGCADTRENAVSNLSKNISVTIQANTNISKVSTNKNYEKTVIVQNNQSSNIQLTNIDIKKENNQYCAYIESDEQKEFLTKLKTELFLYDIKNLPNKVEEKIQMLDIWLSNISRILTLHTIFDVELTDTELVKLNSLNKLLLDERTKLLLLNEKRIWKGCGDDKLESLEELDKIIFENKIKKSEDKDVLDKFMSFLTSTSESDLTINILKNYINTDIKDKQVCSFVEKSKVLEETNRMYSKIETYKKEFLPLDPKEQVKQIDFWINELDMVKLLTSLFPDEFNANHISYITKARKELESLKNSINPQFVKFIPIDCGEDVEILVDKKYKVKPNENYFLKSGKHIFSATTKDRCPISKSFEITYNEDEEIKLSFEDSVYPTVLFNSNKFEAKLSIDGKIYDVAKKYSIPVCNATVPYIITFGEQSYHGSLELKEGENVVKQFDFLSSLEIATFNDTKSKSFKVDMNKSYQGNLSNEKLMSSLLKFSISTSPSNGSISLDERGAFIYTPNKNYRGEDSFKYKVETSTDESAPKLVQVTVVGTNRSPKATFDSINMEQNDSYSGTLTATDEDEDKLTFKLSSQPKNGTVVVEADGDFKYTPNSDFFGMDSFSYTVTDPFKGSDTKSVTINISKTNHAPKIDEEDITIELKQNGIKEFKLKASDEDGDKLTFKVLKDVSNGALKCTEDGICKYTPVEQFAGEDGFEYQVSDGVETSSATVKIIVEKLEIKETKEAVKTVENQEMSEEDYQQFKGYLESLFRSKDEKTLFQLRDKYPNSFNRFILEKTAK